MTKTKPSSGTFAVCVDCTADDVDLVVGKLYVVAKPEPKDSPTMLRIIDDSGEDYLYPNNWFVPINVPPRVKRALAMN